MFPASFLSLILHKRKHQRWPLSHGVEIRTRHVDVQCSKRSPVVRCSRKYCFRSLQWKSPCIQSGLSLLFNSRGTSRDLMCIGSPANALSVSIHLVSTGVTWDCATASRSSTFLVHSVRHFSHTPRYFNSIHRARRTAQHGNSLPVTSSTHRTSNSSPSLAISVAPVLVEHRASLAVLANPSPRSCTSTVPSFPLFNQSVTSLSTFPTSPNVPFALPTSATSAKYSPSVTMLSIFPILANHQPLSNTLVVLDESHYPLGVLPRNRTVFPFSPNVHIFESPSYEIPHAWSSPHL